MSQSYIEESDNSKQISFQSLNKEVGPKYRIPEYDICEKAQAGLSAVIDFKCVSSVLQTKEKDAHGLVIHKAEELRGNTNIRLVHVKGGRKLQIRLVQPSAKVLNDNDSYVLIIPNKIIIWNGRKSSVMKKAKAAELAETVKRKRSYGCSCRFIQTIEHFGKNISNIMINCFNEKSCEVNETVDFTDSDFENSIAKTNMVFEVECHVESGIKNLIFNLDLSGKPLRRSNLNSNKAYVFDFGTEVYLWIGSKYDKSNLIVEKKLALEHFENTQYSYLQDHLNLIKKLENYGYYFPTCGDARPQWTTIEKINEKCENILFKKKFSEWTDLDLKISREKDKRKIVKTRTKIDINGCFRKDISHDFVVLGRIVNRGQGGYDAEHGFNYEIMTENVTVYRVVDTSLKKVEDDSFPFLFSNEAYLVEWKFVHRRADVKNLQGEDVSSENTGRDVYIYYYWQGRDCSITEKALSAVLTIFHVKKKSHQIHIPQDQEHPTFVSLFQGQYVSGIGKFKSFKKDDNHLYLVRGSDKETFLLEVEPSYHSLRSQAHFILICPLSKIIYHWVGSTSNKNISIDKFTKNLNILFQNDIQNFEVKVMNERNETIGFKNDLAYSVALDFSKHRVCSKIEFCCYFNKIDQFNIKCKKISSHLFQILDEKEKHVIFDKFSVGQTNLYSLIQPCLVLVCTGSGNYLWHGWKSLQDDSIMDVKKLSEQSVLKDNNFLETKKAVIEDLMPFLKENNFGEEIIEIHAGLEPDEFTQLFPIWNIRQDIKGIQKKIGRKKGVSQIITETVLAQHVYYPMEVLLQRPLPDSINPQELESYLEDAEFELIFNLTKKEFYELKFWKRKELKIKHNLY